MKKSDLRGKVPESWSCVDCGINTAPGCLNRRELERAYARDWNNRGVRQEINDRSEIYTVKPAVWRAAADDYEGCLCIGCLEKRLGRMVTPRDFLRNHPFNSFPGTERLIFRRERRSSTPRTYCRPSATPTN